MFGRSAMVLVTALLMFPQIVETIYSPALTDISRYFSISAAEAEISRTTSGFLLCARRTK